MSESLPQSGSLLFYVVLESNSPRLDLRQIGLRRLKRLITYQPQVRWNRDGEIRMIPPSVLANAFRSFQDGLKQVDAERLGAMLAATHTIGWEQTVPVQTLAHMEVTFDPAPGVRHTASGDGCERTPTY